MKNWMFKLGALLLMIVATLTGAASGVFMADATALVDGGVNAGTVDAGDGTERGIASVTTGQEAVDELYMTEVDERITKIRPMNTPVSQISMYARKRKTDSMEVKYYSIGTRPLKTTVSVAQAAAQSTGNTIKLAVTDQSMFDVDDTIRVVGVKGYDQDSSNAANEKDLVVAVAGFADDGNPNVYAVNGLKNATAGTYNFIPAIPKGTTLIRMGKACAELDIQAASYVNIPTPETNYCQNFMMQVEQSTFDKIAKKEVNWNFSDLEEDSIFDMRLGQEGSYLFGVKGKQRHPVKKNNVWFTDGIWWMAGKDLTVGTWDADKGCAVITDDEFVDITKELFTGIDSGDKVKVMIAGSDALAAFSKTISEKFMLKEPQKFWEMEFTGFKSEFGTINAIHGEILDMNGMSDCAFILDPSFLTKAVHISYGRNVLDLKTAGIRNSEAVVLQEVCCLYLRSAKAHARLKLTPEPEAPVVTPEPDAIEAEDSTLTFLATDTAPVYVVVDSNVDEWTVAKAAADEWYTVSRPAGSNVIVVTPTANSGELRTGTITLTAGEATDTIAVSQAAGSE